MELFAGVIRKMLQWSSSGMWGIMTCSDVQMFARLFLMSAMSLSNIPGAQICRDSLAGKGNSKKSKVKSAGVVTFSQNRVNHN